MRPPKMGRQSAVILYPCPPIPIYILVKHVGPKVCVVRRRAEDLPWGLRHSGTVDHQGPRWQLPSTRSTWRSFSGVRQGAGLLLYRLMSFNL
jgi:hypothetical protein